MKRIYFFCFQLTLFTFAFVLNLSLANAQNFFTKNFQKSHIGVVTGFGYGTERIEVEEGLYTLMYAKAHFAYELKNNNPAKKSIPLSVRFILEPQINPVLIHTSPEVAIFNWETGINLGVQLGFFTDRKLYPILVISAGPHYYSAKVARQAPGFVFSDNMGLGGMYKASENIDLMFMFHIRHLSNAQIMLPNHGINTYNFVFGVLKNFSNSNPKPAF